MNHSGFIRHPEVESAEENEARLLCAVAAERINLRAYVDEYGETDVSSDAHFRLTELEKRYDLAKIHLEETRKKHQS